MNKSCCGIFGQIFSDFSNSSNVIITRLKNLSSGQVAVREIFLQLISSKGLTR